MSLPLSTVSFVGLVRLTLPVPPVNVMGMLYSPSLRFEGSTGVEAAALLWADDPSCDAPACEAAFSADCDAAPVPCCVESPAASDAADSDEAPD